jgi:DNA-binding transcriptional regulator YdaS (Cro superfamily)
MGLVWLSNRLGISQTEVSQSVKRREKVALENKFRLTQ